ncbi:tRNA pseudouridine(55) synthase TruB [Desulfarculus baarsii]
MGRRRKVKALLRRSGVLVVDKPAGPTSHDLVNALRRRFRPERLGHTGTLDPFATGVLVLVFNQATRLSDLLGGGPKAYEAELVLGRATDTGDVTGRVIEQAAAPALEWAQAEAAVAALVGQRMQSPPAYSAAKHEGKPLYAYARAGKIVEKPARPITIYDARLLGLEAGLLRFAVQCSRGAYVRVLGEDLARALGAPGCLSGLRRVASWPFGLDEAHGLEDALAWSPEELERQMLGLDQALARAGLPTVTLDDHAAWRLGQGQQLPAESLLAPGQGLDQASGPFMARDAAGGLVAVLRWLEPEARAERAYETIRVFPAETDPRVEMTSASALGAE